MIKHGLFLAGMLTALSTGATGLDETTIRAVERHSHLVNDRADNVSAHRTRDADHRAKHSEHGHRGRDHDVRDADRHHDEAHEHAREAHEEHDRDQRGRDHKEDDVHKVRNSEQAHDSMGKVN
ncbi:MAG: hypothetical protein OEW08_08640 [Gammaproteobacteria bacterium]|nr:hypothetical protein [Gammaproteobacteria bacterium]